MSEYKIEKGVPMPPARLGRPPEHEFPLYSMQPGDSFLCEKAAMHRCRHHVSNMHQRHPESKFACRKVPDGGMRVWCLKAVSKTTAQELPAPAAKPVTAKPVTPPAPPSPYDLSENPMAAKLRKISSATGVRRHVSR